MAAVKKSRASLTGAITKASDKLKAIKFSSPKEILLINSKEIDRLLSSIERTETGFLQTLEDGQEFIPVGDGADRFLEEEEATDLQQLHLSSEGWS